MKDSSHPIMSRSRLLGALKRGRTHPIKAVLLTVTGSGSGRCAGFGTRRTTRSLPFASTRS